MPEPLTLPRTTSPRLAASVLALPVTGLPDVSDDAAEALKGIGVSTVYDLARSFAFFVAVQLSTTTDPDADIPADWVDATHPTDTPPAEWPVKTLRTVTNKAATKLTDALGVTTLSGLAAWPAYGLARSLLDFAVGLGAAADDASPSGPVIGSEESAPKDLLPANDLPTETVRYTTLVLGDVHEPKPVAGAASPPSILGATQLDLPEALGKAEAGFKHVAEGALLTYDQTWFNQGVALGDIRKTIPLAAGEVVRVAQRDWSRRESGRRDESGTQTEELDNRTTHGRALTEVAAAVASETQSGFTNTTASSFSQQAGVSMSGGLLGAIFGAPTGSFGEASTSSNAMTVTGSQGDRSVNSSMQQNINEATQQHASAARSRRATVVEEISESDAATASTRILANYNHAHALNVVFYELVQVTRVGTILRKVEKVLFVPMKMLDFTQQDITPAQAGALLPHAAVPDVRDLLERYVRGPMGQFPTLGPKGPGPDPAPDDSGTVQPLVDQVTDLQFLQPGLVESLRWRDIEAGKLPLGGTQNISKVQVTGVAAGAQIIATLSDGTQETADVLASGEADFAEDIDLSKVISVVFNPRNVEIKSKAEVTLALFGDGVSGITVPVGDTPTTVMEVRGPLNDVEKQRLLVHLQRNRVRYNQALWAELDETAIAMLLAGYVYGDDPKPLLQWVNPKPVGFVGNYLVFKLNMEAEAVADGADPKTVGQRWWAWREEHGLGDKEIGKEHDPLLVSMPTDGLFAEAVLGRANCAEKIDISRFINWHEAPIPILPPEISPVGTSGQPQDTDLQPGQFTAPLVNVVAPTTLPAPTLGAATVGAVANGNLFRDMSAAAATIGLAQGALQASQAGAQSASEQATDLQRKQLEIAGKVAEVAAQAAAAYFTGGASLAATGLTAAGGLMEAGKKIDANKAAKPRTTPRPAPGGPSGAPETGGGATPVNGTGATWAAVDGGSGVGAGQPGGDTNLGYEERGLLSALGQDLPPPTDGRTGFDVVPAVFGREDVEKAARHVPYYTDLLRFQVPAPVVDSLNSRSMRVQRFADAIGDLNLDMYPITITKLPTVGGTQLDANGLLKHIRLNLPDFVASWNSVFSPYAPEDATKWASGNPLGTVFNIDIIGPRNAAVVASLVEDNRWRFSTVWAPETKVHPVSGNREFGFRDAGSEKLLFYTRGADRSTGAVETVFSGLTFLGGRFLWESFQDKVAQFVNDHDGIAVIDKPFSEPFKWTVVQDMLRSGEPITL